MKIIAQKTNYSSIDYFFSKMLKEKFISGVSLNIIFTKNKRIVVYSPNTSVIANIVNLEKDMNNQQIITLEEALKKISNIRKDIVILLNIIPIDFSILQNSSLEELARYNREYIHTLNTIINKYANLNIQVHSVSRNLLTLAKQEIKRKIGFFVYGGDLNPFDVNYYVFTTNMIDDRIFEELLSTGKELYLSIFGNDDLDVIVKHYNSEYATALSQEILPHLGMIIAQPYLIKKMFQNYS